MALNQFPLLIKMALLCALYFLHGAPFVGFTDYLFSILCILVLCFGQVRSDCKSLIFALGIGVFILGRLIPTLEIPEQQMIMLDESNNYISIQDYIKTPNNYPFQISGDGYLQGYRDQRSVRNIDIEGGVLSLRNSLINLRKFNFYRPQSSIERRDMPFVIVYEVVSSMVGMVLHASGSLYWKKRDGVFTKLPQDNHILIKPENVGSKIMGFGGAWSDLSPQKLTMSLEKTGIYSFLEKAKSFTFFLGAFLMFMAVFNLPKSRSFYFKCGLLGLSFLFLLLENPEIFRWGLLAQGGGDGVVHDGDAYWMLELWSQGNWGKALMSPESVFYYMPGARYIRFLELLIFGDAYILRISLLVFMPVIFYRFFRLFLGEITSFALSFLVMIQNFLDHIGLSLKLYRASSLKLYGEGISYGLLFIGLVLLLKSPLLKIRKGLLIFFLMGIAISIRPNLLVLVGVLSAVHLFTKAFSSLSWIHRFCMLLGLSPLLLIPIHNIIGGKWVLLTMASDIPENLSLSPGVYLQALKNILGFSIGEPVMPKFIKHFKLLYPHFILAGVGCLWIATHEKDVRKKVLAFATFCGVSMHLFYLPILRYFHPYLTIAVVLGLSYYSVPLEGRLVKMVESIKRGLKNFQKSPRDRCASGIV
jgi:hypothetical protein